MNKSSLALEGLIFEFIVYSNRQSSQIISCVVAIEYCSFYVTVYQSFDYVIQPRGQLYHDVNPHAANDYIWLVQNDAKILKYDRNLGKWVLI